MPSSENMWCLICLKTKKELGLSFHRFPQDEALRQKWINWCVNKGFMENNDDLKYVYLCGAHFEIRGAKRPRKLSRKAVPSLVPRTIIKRKFKTNRMHGHHEPGPSMKQEDYYLDEEQICRIKTEELWIEDFVLKTEKEEVIEEYNFN